VPRPLRLLRRPPPGPRGSGIRRPSRTLLARTRGSPTELSRRLRPRDLIRQILLKSTAPLALAACCGTTTGGRLEGAEGNAWIFPECGSLRLSGLSVDGVFAQGEAPCSTARRCILPWNVARNLLLPPGLIRRWLPKGSKSGSPSRRELPRPAKRNKPWLSASRFSSSFRRATRTISFRRMFPPWRHAQFQKLGKIDCAKTHIQYVFKCSPTPPPWKSRISMNTIVPSRVLLVAISGRVRSGDPPGTASNPDRPFLERQDEHDMQQRCQLGGRHRSFQ